MKIFLAALVALSIASTRAGQIPLHPYGDVFAPPGYVWDFGMKRDSDCGVIRSGHFTINLDFGNAAGVYTKGLSERVVDSFHGKVLRDLEIPFHGLQLHLILYSAEGKNHAVASYPELRQLLVRLYRERRSRRLHDHRHLFHPDEKESRPDKMRAFIHFLVLLAILVGSPAHAAGSPGPLSADLPPNWSIKYSDDGKHSLYILAKNSPDKVVFNFAKWLSPETPAQVSEMMTSTSPGDPRLTDVFQPPLSGTVTSHTDSHGVSARFVFAEGNSLWTGMFHGTAPQWKEALAILKTLKGQTSQP